MTLSNDRAYEIFYEIVGDPDDHPYDYVSYLENISDSSTEEEAKEFAKIIKETSDESEYE